MKHDQSLGVRVISLAIVASVLLSACNQPEPTPTQTTAATAMPGTTAAAPANTATVRPTAGPTATPRPLGNPILIDREPLRGEELQLDKPVVLVFDQPMDRATVEQAVQIVPQVQGAFRWERDNVVAFTPNRGWDRAMQYTVNLKDAAKSARGLALARNESFNISTIGYLDVAQTIPANESTGVSADTRITVLFNRPVVPLTGIDQQAALPTPVVFDPPIEGRGEWLNTSIYLFRPAKPLASGVVYRGIVAAGLQDTTGALLEKEYAWTFSIAPPIVKGISPLNASTDVDLRQPISVTFSQKMDHASAEAAFSLTPPVKGTFRWADEASESPQDRASSEPMPVGTPPQVTGTGEVMAFYPDEDYTRGTQYRVDIAAGAKGTGGSSATERASRFAFTSIMLPDVVSTAPQNGATKADATSGFSIRFSAPVLPETVVPNLRFEPAISLTRVYSYYDSSEKRFYLNLQLKPSTRYRVVIGGNIRDKYGVTIGKDTEVQFVTAPYMPYAVLNTSGQIGSYNSSRPTRLFATYRNISRMDLELASLSLRDLYDFTGGFNSYDALRKYRAPENSMLRRWSVSVSAALNEGAYQQLDLAAGGGSLTPGIYLLTMTAPEAAATVRYYEPARHILVVTNMQVTLKQGVREALAWVTGLNSGQPLSGQPVEMRDQGFGSVYEGATDAEGKALASFDRSFEEYQPFYVIVGEPGTASFGLAFNRWDQGINPWDYSLQAQFGNAQNMAYLYTDRPIYRPGQMVYFKGIVRAEYDSRYTLADDVKNVDLSITNDQGQQVYSVTLPVNSNGAFNGSFALDNGAASGWYFAQICLPYEQYVAGNKGAGLNRPESQTNGPCRSYGVSFQVATYRRPEFEVSMSTDKTDYLAGDTVKATVKATYFFGGNVGNAKVQWTLMAREYYFSRYTGPGYYSFGAYDSFYRGVSYNEFIANGEGVTDASGQLVISVPADLSKRKNSTVFALEASITDVNDQSVSARVEAVVHKADYYLGIAPELYVGEVDKEARFNIIAVDWQGAPVAEKAATVSFYRREWFTAQEEDAIGNLTFNSVPSDTLVTTQAVRMDSSGKGAVVFTPAEGGEYYIEVKDATNPAPVAATSFYVSSGKAYVSWRVNNNDRIELKTDKQDYKVGEVVKVLVPSPYSGTVTALLTVERGRFLMTKLVQLASNSDIIEIPVEPSFAPNAFVSVFIVQGVDANNPVAEYKMGYAGFSVDAEQFELNVDIKTAKQEYGPRDTVTYDIRVTDARGNPAQAELSLSLVDKAVLSLADPNSLPIFDAFYGTRGLGIRTATSLNINVDRVTAKIVTENAKGGGGGGGMAAMLDGLFVRQNFKDTAFWQADLTTDAQGRAQAQVTLPDNLTTWKMDARAITNDSKAGQGVHEILSTKPLLVRPVTPRFFVVGDSVTLGAAVNNNTDSDIQAEVTLEARGVSVANPAPQMVTVKAKGSARVDWQVTVDDAVSAELTFNVKGGGMQDSSKPGLATAPNQGIPILRYVSPEIVATAGDVSEPGKKQELIALPPRLDTGKGQLDIEINPSLASVIKTGDEALREYPYESSDTTASRMLVSLAVNNDLTRDTVARGMQRLLSSQHSDGGWGWWIADESSRALTAYALLALAAARDAGYAVDANAITRTREYLTNQLVRVDAQPDLANQQALLLYALTMAGADDSGRLGALYEMREALSYAGKALLALSLEANNPGDTRVKALLSDIASGAVAGPAGVMWQEKELNYFIFDSNTRSTSIVLLALAKLDPQSALSTNVVRWLMVAREGDTWETNQEIGWAVMALSTWSKAVGERDANYTWRVTLNDAAVLNGTATAQNMSESSKLTVAVADLLTTQANTLIFERGAGTGRMYYTARLKVFLPADEVKALNRGIVIARKYEMADCKPEPGEPCASVNNANIGQNVRVRLTIVAPTDLYFVRVVDPLPGGAEVVDTSLKTSQQVGTQTEVQEIGGWGGWGWWWFSHTELRDDHAALFASYLPAGTYEYTYVIRPSIAGAFKVLPASAHQTYFPETFGRSDGAQFTIGK